MEPEDIIKNILNEYGIDKISQMQNICPVKTGRLRDSFGMAVYGRDLIIENRAPYSGFVDRGTIFMDPREYTAPIYTGLNELESNLSTELNIPVIVQIRNDKIESMNGIITG